MNKCISILATITLLLYVTRPVSAVEPKRPNILFAFADDRGRYASVFEAVEGAGAINLGRPRPSLRFVKFQMPNTDGRGRPSYGPLHF